MHGYTHTYLSSDKKNGWPQELKKFRRVHYQRFMITCSEGIATVHVACHTVNCSVSDMHILYSWLQNNYCYDTHSMDGSKKLISHATLS